MTMGPHRLAILTVLCVVVATAINAGRHSDGLITRVGAAPAALDKYHGDKIEAQVLQQARIAMTSRPDKLQHRINSSTLLSSPRRIQATAPSRVEPCACVKL